MIIVKSSVFKMFSVHTKRRSRRFQIPSVCRALPKRPRLRDGLLSVDGSPDRRNKASFSNVSSVMWTRAKSPLDSWSSTSRPAFFAISSWAISYVMSACFKEDDCISAGWWKTYRWLVPNMTLTRRKWINKAEKNTSRGLVSLACYRSQHSKTM